MLISNNLNWWRPAWPLCWLKLWCSAGVLEQEDISFGLTAFKFPGCCSSQPFSNPTCPSWIAHCSWISQMPDLEQPDD
eukprot:1137628-Pelagomonas_calceolata.AAC.6